MKKKFTLSGFSFWLFLFTVCSIATKAQGIDEIKKQCATSNSDTKASLLISTFHVSAPSVSKGIGKQLSEKLIQHMGQLDCFSTNKTVSDFIPKGTQAIITGDLKDYYTSEGVLGKPRIGFEIEIRNASTQEIIATKEIKSVGKLYLGAGNNKPLATAWNNAMDEAAVFVYAHLEKIASQAQAKETTEKVIDTTIHFQNRVKRKSTWDQMKDHSEEKRAENRNRSLNLSDYYNDTVVYKEYPKKPSDKFLEYTINGKKYLFQENARSIDNTAAIESYEGSSFSRHGLKIQVRPSTLTTFMTLDIFYPFRFPKARRFHFGNDSTYDARIPSERKALSFEMNFLAAFELISEWGIQRRAKEKYRIFSLIDRTGKVESNIEGGYIQVLDFETGMYGAIEVAFKFRTKPYTDKDGKQIPAMKIEGRARARGNYSAK